MSDDMMEEMAIHMAMGAYDDSDDETGNCLGMDPSMMMALGGAYGVDAGMRMMTRGGRDRGDTTSGAKREEREGDNEDGDITAGKRRRTEPTKQQQEKAAKKNNNNEITPIPEGPDAPQALFGDLSEGDYGMSRSKASIKSGEAGYLDIKTEADIPTKSPAVPLRHVKISVGGALGKKAMVALAQHCDKNLAQLDLCGSSGMSGSDLVALAQKCSYIEWVDAKYGGSVGRYGWGDLSLTDLKEFIRLSPRLKFMDIRDTSVHQRDLASERPSNVKFPKQLLLDL